MALRIHLVLAIAACVAACTPQGIDVHGASLAPATDGLAVIRIERSFVAPAPPEPEAVSTSVDAVFARYQGIGPDEVLELLGWPGRAEPLAGCRWGAPGGAGALLADAAVDLLDVGALHVDLGGESIALEGRLFPSVQSLVAGTIYGEELATSLPTPPLDIVPSEYRLFAAGTATVGQIEAVVPAPVPPTGVLVEGRPLEPGLELERTSHVGVRWDAGDPDDRIEIEIRAGDRLLRCTTEDVGSFLIRVEALSAMPADERARIAIGRVRREPIEVTGAFEAFARLVSRRATPITLR